MGRGVLTLCLAALFTVGLSGISAASLIKDINYLASTGQTAHATFDFTAPAHLTITLVETSTDQQFAEALLSQGRNADLLLTGIGFLLPGSVQIDPTHSHVTIALDGHSQSVGFQIPGPHGPTMISLGQGADVSHEWGATLGKKPIGDGHNYDFVSTIAAQVTQLPGLNR